MRKYCVITLRSVFVQGIRALDTLSPYIYYELLLIPLSFIRAVLNHCNKTLDTIVQQCSKDISAFTVMILYNIMIYTI